MGVTVGKERERLHFHVGKVLPAPCGNGNAYQVIQPPPRFINCSILPCADRILSCRISLTSTRRWQQDGSWFPRHGKSFANALAIVVPHLDACVRTLSRPRGTCP